MALKTLSADAKSAFASAGIDLTPTQEHLAAEAGLDWKSLLTTLGQAALKIIPILIAILAGNNPPTVPSKMQAPVQLPDGKYCDHHACCCAVLASALETASLAADHCCQCCEGGYGS